MRGVAGVIEQLQAVSQGPQVQVPPPPQCPGSGCAGGTLGRQQECFGRPEWINIVLDVEVRGWGPLELLLGGGCLHEAAGQGCHQGWLNLASDSRSTSPWGGGAQPGPRLSENLAPESSGSISFKFSFEVGWCLGFHLAVLKA